MIKILFAMVLGYLFGSIPWALVIGKVFYKTDVRNFGSGNLGGTNAGRVLGKKAGVTVIILDGLKAFFVVGLCVLFVPEAAVYAGLACCAFKSASSACTFSIPPPLITTSPFSAASSGV